MITLDGTVVQTAEPDLTGTAPALAVLSHDGVYRYLLTRRWDPQEPVVVWLMLNPSTADALNDDPTIRRCAGFARAWGYGGIAVLNLFALRATHPADLYIHPDPVGPVNDLAITALLGGAAGPTGPVVAAWGAHGQYRGRGAAVAAAVRRLGQPLVYLGEELTRTGQPRHPLYLRADSTLTLLEA